MSLPSLLSLISAISCLVLGGFIYTRNRRNMANIGFALGMVCLSGAEFSVFMISLSDDPATVLFWGKSLTVGQAFFPGSWLLYSLAFARRNAVTTLRRWRPILAVFFLSPLIFFSFYWSRGFITLPSPHAPVSVLIVSSPGYIFTIFLLLAMVIVLMNLEQTFRSSAGFERLKIKYMIIGSSAILGLKVYEAGQVLLYSLIRFDSFRIQSTSLLLANALIFFFVVHRKLLDADIFVSRFIVFRSATLLLTGIYMLLVGLLVFGIQRFGGAAYVQFIPLLIFIALLGLVILFLSERVRVKVKSFIVTHFYRSKHDFRVLWPEFSQRVGTKLTLSELLPAYVSWLANTLGTNEVSIWLLDPGSSVFNEQCLVSGKPRLVATDSPFAQFLDGHDGAVIVEEKRQDEAWLRMTERCGDVMDAMRGSVYLPIRSGRKMMGFLELGRKIAGLSYDAHDLEFLMTIADQTAGQIERVRLGEELTSAREMHAFHTLSSFFVHDLKNHAATLSLLAQNALVHGENPEFREDAFKTIRETASKINQLIKNVSLGSKSLVLSRSEVDLNRLIETTCSGLNGALRGQIHSNLGHLPGISADPDQISTVIRNLVINASDAIDVSGAVTIETGTDSKKVFLSVADNGCGMSPEFIATSLFKPLRTTKPAGWGIGLFQCRQIVEAHGGRIKVESEEGKGSRFRVELPLRSGVGGSGGRGVGV